MKFVHCGRDEFIQRNISKDIVVWGASKGLEEAIADFNEKGFRIEDRIVAIIDKDEKKQGCIWKIKDKEYEVKHPMYLKNEEFEDTCLLITSRFYQEIIKELKKINVTDNVEVYVYPCLILDNENTPEKKYASRITNQSLLEYDEYLEARYDLAETEKDRMRQSMMDYLEGANERLPRILPSVVLMHSNICSLKCESCCDLIPKVQNPYYISAEDVLLDLNNLLRGVDKCIRVDLTDGEVFLYRELDMLLEHLIQNDKIETVFMFTNATIIPKESTLKLLQNKKCFLHISDYGLDEKMSKFVDLLKRYSINYTILKNMTWMNFKLDNIQKREETREWLRYDFWRCGNKRCSKPLYYGKLYGCMPAFRYANLGIFEDKRDYVQLLESDSDEDIWKKLKGLCMINYIQTCDMCNFANTGLEIISAGTNKG